MFTCEWKAFRNGYGLIYCDGSTTAQQVKSSSVILISKQQKPSTKTTTLKYRCELPPRLLRGSTWLHRSRKAFKNTQVRDCGCHQPDGTWNAHLCKTLGDSQCGAGGTEPSVTLASDPPQPAPSLRHTLLHNNTHPFLIPPSHACPS